MSGPSIVAVRVSRHRPAVRSVGSVSTPRMSANNASLADKTISASRLSAPKPPSLLRQEVGASGKVPFDRACGSHRDEHLERQLLGYGRRLHLDVHEAEQFVRLQVVGEPAARRDLAQVVHLGAGGFGTTGSHALISARPLAPPGRYLRQRPLGLPRLRRRSGQLLTGLCRQLRRGARRLCAPSDLRIMSTTAAISRKAGPNCHVNGLQSAADSSTLRAGGHTVSGPGTYPDGLQLELTLATREERQWIGSYAFQRSAGYSLSRGVSVRSCEAAASWHKGNQPLSGGSRCRRRSSGSRGSVSSGRSTVRARQHLLKRVCQESVVLAPSPMGKPRPICPV
jgi:hypothetical protein